MHLKCAAPRVCVHACKCVRLCVSVWAFKDINLVPGFTDATEHHTKVPLVFFLIYRRPHLILSVTVMVMTVSCQSGK